MSGIQAKLLAILASLLTALPPSACCLLVLQPCCASEISRLATNGCCRHRLAEPPAPSCCAHKNSPPKAELPLAPASEGPCPAKMCCCAKTPVIAPVVGAAWQPELSVPLYVLPADWGTSQSFVSRVAPAWAMHPPSAARHVLLCVWRC